MSETTLKNTYLARERATQSLITPHTYYAQLAHRINHSAQFENGRVKDKMPNVPSPQSFWQVCWAYMGGRSPLSPDKQLPYSAIEPTRFLERQQAMRVTWLGHSTLMIETDGVRILTDPVFDYASPLIAKAWFERNIPNTSVRDSLQTPDVILISHDHYDHLEASTIRYYSDRSVTFYVPLGVGKHLIRWGVRPDNVVEFDWWENVQYANVELICTPANHNSGRTYLDKNTTLWASWVVKGQQETLYFSGDTAYDNHFVQIAQRCGPIDIACLEVAADVKGNQGYPVENWGHMQAHHTVQAFKDLQAKKLLPVHWATYELFTHKWDEPIEDLIAHCQVDHIELLTPMAGESFYVAQQYKNNAWWQVEKLCEQARKIRV
ncbi:MBL fold metallo-hydrolase [Vibrio harveyi]|uniref:MBL fold metallo-hydrolase n=1 Tax=Vibrio harveyi TaxID=669 RepID=UPI001EFCC7F7|nr:MBL fold metallo-hydrolase [Vibrio harveyi]MCG9611363.1 MBL fold metallo-hydrolase [Vibrio harveyi]MCG9669469.1 MBL fold metallo-hydrolase [Vibrio harveyi]